MKTLKQALKERGQRLTPQRLAIYEYLRESKEHPAVDTIFDDLKGRYPSLSRNTVYQTVQLLLELGLIQELPAEGRQARYDGNPTGHAHLICLQCDRIWDIETDIKDIVKELNQEVEDRGFEVTQDQVQIYGYCPDCQEQ